MTQPYVPKLGGWVPEGPSPEDLIFSSVSSELAVSGSSKTSAISAIETPSMVDLRPWCSPVENQGHLSSCVGNSVVGALELLRIKAGLPHIDLSRLFVYYNARLMHGWQDKDQGTFIKTAMGSLSSLGTCTEAKWAYDPSKVFTRPTWGSYREAYANKIDKYYSIDVEGNDRIDQIKQALRAKYPVVFGMVIANDYTGYRGGVVPLPRPKQPDAGGHAQLIVGFDDSQNVFIVRNSWGTWWGDKGYAYMSYQHLNVVESGDYWVPTVSV